MYRLLVGGTNGSSNFSVHSPDITHDKPIDKDFTLYGQNNTPVIEWKNVPHQTVELVLLCYDPDAKRISGIPWVHWFVHNIDPKVHSTSSLKSDFIVGQNDFKNAKYDGPKPPDSCVHHYHFVVYALKIKSGFDPNETYDYNKIMDVLEDKIIIMSEIVGTFEYIK